MELMLQFIECWKWYDFHRNFNDYSFW